MFLFIFCPCASNRRTFVLSFLYTIPNFRLCFYQPDSSFAWLRHHWTACFALLKFPLWFSLGNFFLFYVCGTRRNGRWKVPVSLLNLFFLFPCILIGKGLEFSLIFLSLVRTKKTEFFFIGVPGCWCQMSWVPFFLICDRSLSVEGTVANTRLRLSEAKQSRYWNLSLLSFAPFLCHINCRPC